MTTIRHIPLLRPAWGGMTLLVLALFMLNIVPAGAQSETVPYDPAALAARFRGYTGLPDIPPVTPLYRPGDSETFFVSKAGSPIPVPVRAVLAGSAGSLYLWVEEGMTFNGLALQTRAQNLGSFYDLLRLRGNYTEPTYVFGFGYFSSPTGDLSIPDVDNDPHVFVIYMRDGLENRSVYVPAHSLPPDYAPAGVTHGHETILINTSALPGVPLDDGIYATDVVRSLYELVMFQNNPSQPRWLREALIDALLRQTFQQAVPSAQIDAFMNAPALSLIDSSPAGTSLGVAGMQALFLNYLLQRYEQAVITPLFLQGGSGVQALDSVLRAQGITDPLTDTPTLMRDVFVDFTLANVINAAVGDGRYQHVNTALTREQRPVVEIITDVQRPLQGQTVSQFGARYYAVTPTEGGTVTLTFDGVPVSPRLLSNTDRPLDDRFYWSGGQAGSHRILTRTVDLRGVETASLQFDAWYQLSPYWNYGYVTVSVDDGLTWQILDLPTVTSGNPYGNAYGSGFTGISNPEPERPFPVIGITFSDDGIGINEVSPSSPAEAAGIRVGDRLVGVDGAAWENVPNIFGVLAEYRPGDTLNLFIERGGERRNIPVVLGAHPSRRVIPQPLWEAHTVDLTPYAGREIRLGFEVVSLPGHDDQGFAVDNLTIPEIGWADDGGTAQGWQLEGWQAVDNIVRQAFAVTALQTGSTAAARPARVIPLIAPGDSATSGSWSFSLAPNESLLIAVSGLNDDTRSPAAFDLAWGG
ncbi:MAG: PDZ domain-containing protein [bacterium]|nr:PDZ domain-containing protein [bacterium]